MYRLILCLTAIALTLAGGAQFVCADDAGTIDHGLKGVAAGAPVMDILQLTQNPYNDWEPCWGAYPWSSDGQWLVYQSNRELAPREEGREIATKANQICKIRPDGSGWAQLTDTPACDSHPSFVPPANGRIVFQSDRPDENYGGVIDYDIADIFMMNSDGSNVELLTKGAEFPPCECDYNEVGHNKPVVSPDGARIAYRRQALLQVMNTDADVDGKRYPHLVSDEEHACCRQTWIDSEWVLYDAVWGELEEDEKHEDNNPVGRRIYKAKADGSQVVPLTDDNLVITDAQGQYIDTASNTYPGGGCTGWAAKGENWAFASPDGQWIAYHTRWGVVKEIAQPGTTTVAEYYEEQKEYSGLCIMKADGSEKRNLVVKGGGPEGTGLDPEWTWVCGPKAWSPDSQWIAFKMWSAGSLVTAPKEDKEEDESEPPLRENGTAAHTSVFMINIDTLQIVQLTDGFNDYRMWWSPDGDHLLFRDGSNLSRDEGLYGDDLLVMGVSLGDRDNITDQEEQGPGGNDNAYDGNQDTTPDWTQDHVASFHGCTGAYATLVAPEGTILSGISSCANPSDGPLPEGILCPLGFFGFTVTGLTPGALIEVQLILPPGIEPTTYWKYSPELGFYEFSFDPVTGTGALIEGNVVRLFIRDGGRGDHDNAADGSATDPGAPVIPLARIPALNGIGLLGLLVLVAGAGCMALRRSRRAPA